MTCIHLSMAVIVMAMLFDDAARFGAHRRPAKQGTPSLADRFGFRSAVIVPAPSGVGLGRTGMLSLGSNTPGFFEADGFVNLRTLARGLAMDLHEWWIAKLRREVIDDAELTEG